MSVPPALAAKEQALVELSQWISRALQYQPGHPSCAPLAARTHATLSSALEETSPLEFGILKDDVVMGEARASHPALRTRVAPYLHERGVLVLRFAAGTTQADLAVFVELIARSAQAVFEAGGLAQLLLDRGVTRIQVDEIAHEVTGEEREEHRRRRRLHTLFAEMVRRVLVAPGTAGLAADQLAELLAQPEVAVAGLEESGDVAQTAACLALVAQRKDAKGEEPFLAPNLRSVLSALSPHAREGVVLGAAVLAGELRVALAWLVHGYAHGDLARFVFPCIREHSAALDPFFRSLVALLPEEGQRFAVLGAAGLLLHDLPADDPTTPSTLAALMAPIADHDAFRAERVCLAEHAGAAHAAEQQEAEWHELMSAQPPSLEPPAFDGSSAVFALVKMAGGMKDFDVFVRRLPRAAESLAAQGSIDAVMGMLRGLAEIDGAQWKNLAPDAIDAIAVPGTVTRIIEELDRVGIAEGQEVDDVVALVKLLGSHCPQPLFDWLERSANRKVRRILLEALPLAHDKLLPILRGRMSGANWHVARNVVLLLPRAGGTTADLAPLAHHANPRVRLEVVRSLRLLPVDAAAAAILVDYLVDESPEIVRAARAQLRVESLGAPSIDALARQAEDERLDDESRRFAIEMLGHSPADAAATALFHVLQPKGLLELNASTRDHAATALRGSPAPSAPGLFEQGLASSVWRVRRACERAAGKP
jgi:hypothetical protein